MHMLVAVDEVRQTLEMTCKQVDLFQQAIRHDMYVHYGVSLSAVPGG